MNQTEIIQLAIGVSYISDLGLREAIARNLEKILEKRVIGFDKMEFKGWCGLLEKGL